MRIDSHQHFWKYDAIRDSWMDDSMGVIKKDFMPSDLFPIFKKNNIDGCVAVQASQSEVETKFLLQCAKEYTFIKGVVGWVDLCDEKVEERLSFFSQNDTFKGVRHIVQDEPDAYFMLRPDFQRGISSLKKFDLSYDILIYPKQLPAAIELVRMFPDQPFVLDHIAKPCIKKKELSAWTYYMKEIGKYENVYCKISGMVTEANWKKWELNDFIPYLHIVFEAFGTNRIMFGSDWPVCLLAGNYCKVLNLVRKYLNKYQKKDVDKIMGDNAAKFYGINPMNNSQSGGFIRNEA